MSFVTSLFPPADPATPAKAKRTLLGRILLSGHLLSIALISCAIAFTSITFLVQLRHETEQQAYAVLERRMQIFWQFLRSKGELSVAGGKLMAGRHELNNNSEIPDKIREIFGATAAVFLQDVPGNGARKLDAPMTGSPRQAIFRDNRRFRGEGDIFGIPHITAYDPITNKNGEPIGALFVAVPKSDFLPAYNRRKVEIVAAAVMIEIVFVLLSISLLRQRKKYMDSLRRSEELYRSLFDSSTEGILLLKDTVLACNERACTLFGCGRQDIVGKRIADVLPPLHLDSPEFDKERTLHWRYRRPGGNTIDAEIAVRPLEIDGGPAWQVMVNRQIPGQGPLRTGVTLDQLQRLAAILAQPGLLQQLAQMDKGQGQQQGQPAPQGQEIPGGVSPSPRQQGLLGGAVNG